MNFPAQARPTTLGVKRKVNSTKRVQWAGRKVWLKSETLIILGLITINCYLLNQSLINSGNNQTWKL